MNDKSDELFKLLISKGSLKQQIYNNTLEVFKTFKDIARELSEEYAQQHTDKTGLIPFDFRDRGEFEFELKFAGDILVFMMHTNVFEFPRDHMVMKTSYVKEDIARSYCGIINIFNFLSDSFKYKRMNDLGYMIGRLFINKDKHYFLEGKREIGLLYINFANALINKAEIRKIVTSAMEYTINFDLLTPPYNNVKEVSVSDMLAYLDTMKLKTGKRLGFRFSADNAEDNN